jgi:uncharacterized membrane protein
MIDGIAIGFSELALRYTQPKFIFIYVMIAIAVYIGLNADKFFK